MRQQPSNDRHLMSRFRRDIGFEIKIPVSEVPEIEVKVTKGAAPGDARKLRGIPCLAEGVGGAMMGTLPHVAVIKKEKDAA